ncbi:hypothetical protein SVIO_029740 [Streptomyces violaceusniger]|uniref:Short-chain dehydrogenase n=1 Tax=Streptomyces violaceusniger TaxID=68280 RepID=A0A4D4KSN7_STRVO|nr:hypothetical protein SVIO_029740 [Streptomyces violaceusniger]
MTTGDFEGLAALVTGGASGIGAAIAATLRDRGARVAVLDRDPSGAPDGTLPLKADVTSAEGVRTAVDAAVAEFGALHTVVGNAGIGAIGSVEDNSDEEWHRVLDINVLGLVRTARAALPHLRAAAADRPGAVSITHTCSIAATAGLPQRAAYSASKGAVLSLTLAMAADHIREGVRVNCVNPGTVDTPWVGRLLDQAPTRRPSAPPWRPGSPPDGWSPPTRWPRPSRTSPARRRGRHRHRAGRRRRDAGAAAAPRLLLRPPPDRLRQPDNRLRPRPAPPARLDPGTTKDGTR